MVKFQVGRLSSWQTTQFLIPEKFPVVNSPAAKHSSSKTFRQENIPAAKHSDRKTFQSVNIPAGKHSHWNNYQLFCRKLYWLSSFFSSDWLKLIWFDNRLAQKPFQKTWTAVGDLEEESKVFAEILIGLPLIWRAPMENSLLHTKICNATRSAPSQFRPTMFALSQQL